MKRKVYCIAHKDSGRILYTHGGFIDEKWEGHYDSHFDITVFTTKRAAKDGIKSISNLKSEEFKNKLYIIELRMEYAK